MLINLLFNKNCPVAFGCLLIFIESQDFNKNCSVAFGCLLIKIEKLIYTEILY
jgi:hypothetical protein